MEKKNNILTKVFLATTPLALVNIGILVYQFSHLVISPWNIIPTLILLFIVLGNVINMMGFRPKGRFGSFLTQFGAPPSETSQEPQLGENDAFVALNSTFPKKLTLKNIILKTLFMAIFIALTCLFSFLGSNIKYDQVVTGTVIEKHIEGEVYTEYDNGESTTTDNRVLVMTVSYTVGEDMYRTEIVDKFSITRDSSFIDLCVNNDGTYVCPYDKVMSYKIMTIAALVFAVLTFLGFVFKLPNVYLAILVIGVVGMGIICLFNSANWAGWLLKDFTLFGGCFVTLCAMVMIELILIRIIYAIGSKRDSNFKIS